MDTGTSGADGLYPFGYQSAPATPEPSNVDLLRSVTPDTLRQFVHRFSGLGEIPNVVDQLDGSLASNVVTDVNN